MMFCFRGVEILFFLCLFASAGFADENTIPVASPVNMGLSKTHGLQSVHLLTSSVDRLEFEFVSDSFSISKTKGGMVLSALGTDKVALPGQPDLPGRVVLVGIPQKGHIRLSVSADKARVLTGVEIKPAPGFEPTELSPVYKKDRFWPAALAQVISLEVLRNVRVARIRINPVQYNPVHKVLRIYHRLQVTILFDRPAEPVHIVDTFDHVLEQVLLNGKEARNWKLGHIGQDTINFFHRSNIWCKVKTETTGVYKIAPSDLSQAGFNISDIDPKSFRLWTIGSYKINEAYPDTMIEVPVYVQGEEDSRFDNGDYIAFYAEAPSHWNEDQTEWLQNLFTRYRYFWLTWGTGQGKRMEAVSGAGAVEPRLTAPNHVRLEEDKLCPARSGLLWLWTRYFKQAGVNSSTNELSLALPDRDTIYEISGRFYGRKDKNDPTQYHYARLYLNGFWRDSLVIRPSYRTPPPADFVLDSIPKEAGARTGVGDTLTIEIYGDPEMEGFLDYLEVRYAERLKVSSSFPFIRFYFNDTGVVEFGVQGATADALILDVTDPFSPKRIIGASLTDGQTNVRIEQSGLTEYASVLLSGLRAPLAVEQRFPGSLRSLAEHINYYIVCPDEFYAAARMFARYREANVAGIPTARVRAVRLSSLYDDYTFGMEEPGAIKKFFGAKQPDYGLLAGDATYDYRNNLDMERPPSVPAYEMGFDINYEVYQSAAKALDAWFADFEGQGGSPDMILGRITCRSPFELRRFTEKVRRYETQPLGFWAKRFLLLADDEWKGSPEKPDEIGFTHIGGCENAMLYATGLDPVKIYLTEYPFTGMNNKAGARQDLLDRLHQGALFWCFFGHGAGFQLCHERVLHIDGVPQIENEGRNPLAFFGSCGVGRFEDTRYECIAEELVRKEDGCIASTGAIKSTGPGGNETFGRLLFSSLVDNPLDPIGPAFYKAWLTNTDYHLFGDPATMVRLPAPGLEPTVLPDTFYPGGRVSVTDSVPRATGMYGISVHEADWFRCYSSDYGSTTYLLPGYEIHNALGSFDSGFVHCSFTVPKIDYPDTVIVANGSYVRLPNSSRVSLLCWDRAEGYASRHNSIPLGEPVQTEDTAPPELTLFADKGRLSTEDTVLVPKHFVLKGILSDESGILVASVPDYRLSLFLGARTSGRIDLLTYFSYDKNSCHTGRFEYPVDIDHELDSLTVIAADNMRNRLVGTYYVRTKLSDVLRMTDCLVYPNPVSGPTRFTFVLSRAAFVSVKIYTISGRLIRRLPDQLCFFGYNQIEWDGLDEQGGPLANGVYLYKLDAHASEVAGGGQSSASLRDKFIVQH